MADFATSLFYEHEIAKDEDFIFSALSVIKNTRLLDRMLVSAQTDYIVGGRVVAGPGAMDIYIEPMWGNGIALDLPVYRDSNTTPMPIEPAVEARIDTVEVMGVMEPYDSQRRAFFNPEVENGQYFMTNTKTRLSMAVQIKRGAPGEQYAPVADEGWLKIAEIVLPEGTEELTQSNIKNVTAIYQNGINEFWSNQKYRTFSLGSQAEMKQMFGLEHNLDGSHRLEVIKAANILIGALPGALKASILPLGEGFTGGGLAFTENEVLTDALKREADKRKEHTDATAAHESSATPTASRIAMFTPQGRLKSGAAPAASDDVVRLTEYDAAIVQIAENRGKINTLWAAVFMDLTSNPYEMTFADLDGVLMEYGVWNEGLARVECTIDWTATDPEITANPFDFDLAAGLYGIDMEYGVWNKAFARVEC